LEHPDIILIFPHGGETIKVAHFPPHALLAVAADLIDDYNVKIVDERIDPDCKNKLKSYIASNPTCIAISVMTGQHITYALETAKYIRSIAGKSILCQDVPICINSDLIYILFIFKCFC